MGIVAVLEVVKCGLQDFILGWWWKTFEYAIHTYKKVKQEKIEWTEPEDSYKFELVRVDIHNQYTYSKEHKVYIKDGYKYKLIKDEKTTGIR